MIKFFNKIKAFWSKTYQEELEKLTNKRNQKIEEMRQFSNLLDHDKRIEEAQRKRRESSLTSSTSPTSTHVYSDTSSCSSSSDSSSSSVSCD